MKKLERGFVVEVGQNALLGVSPESIVTIHLMNYRAGRGTTKYSATVEWLHTTLARKHQRENPTGRKRRRFFSSSEEMKKYLKEHPGEEP